MINVRITRASAQGVIVGFAVKGHAEYARNGKDIVCAGVSTVTVGTVNAIESLAKRLYGVPEHLKDLPGMKPDPERLLMAGMYLYTCRTRRHSSVAQLRYSPPNIL